MGNSIFKRNNRVHNEIYDNISENENQDNTICERQIPYIDHNRIYYKNNQCVICLENYSGVRLNCGHDQFCYECISNFILHNKYYEKTSECPLCRTIITNINFDYNLSFNII